MHSGVATTNVVTPTAAKIESLVAEARRLDMLIIWVRAHYDDINTGAAMADFMRGRFGGGGEGRCLAGSWGANWFGNLQPNSAPKSPSSAAISTQPSIDC